MHYNKVSVEMRETLIKKVLTEGISVKRAAAKLGIKYSTAKHIFHFYKQTGDARSPLMVKKEQQAL